MNGDGARELTWLRGTGAFFLPSAGNAQYAYPGLQPTFLDLTGGGLPFAIPGPRHLPVIDMDGDGREDLVAGVNILLNRAPLPPVSATCSPGR